MRIVLLATFLVLCKQNLWAQMYYVNPKGLNSKQSNNFQKHLLIVHKLLPKSVKKINDINISFKHLKSSNSSEVVGNYNAWQNEIVFNIDSIPENSFSFELHKTIIHELSHVYDHRVNTIHNDYRFLYLSGWHKRGLFLNRTRRRNFMEQRSPDPYEFSHPKETFAVNMEYFLSQKEYKCRRPLLYEYLVGKLKHVPFKDIKCNFVNKIPIFVKGQPFLQVLNPEKIYEIHYLKAGSGKGIVSGFGHSMLRIIMCSPKRKVVSERCLNDSAHHLVLSYRANITDSLIDYWDGLVGKYPSQLFVMNFMEVITEYNQLEFRDLTSYPIKLSRKELNRVSLNISNEVWAYQGKYRFITQNCATETMDFLKVVISNDKILKQRVKTPTGVYEELNELKLVHDEDDESMHGKYVFKSKKDVYDIMYAKIQPNFTQYKDFNEFITFSNPTERIEAFDNFISENKDLSTLASMRSIESHIRFIKQKDFLKIITKVLVEVDDLPQFVRDYIKFKVTMQSLSELDKLYGYGIPSENEFQEIELIFKSLSDQNLMKSKLQKWFQKKFKSAFLEKEKIEENIKYFQKTIKEKLKRRSK